MIFGTGLIPEPYSKSNYRIEHLAAALWKPFDWSKGYDVEKELKLLLPVKDQGPNLSCVGQSSATYAYVQNAFELKSIYGDKLLEALQELSAKSIYSQIALSSGGAFMGDALRLIKSFGITPEVLVPSYEWFQGDRIPLSEDKMKEKYWINQYTSNRSSNYKSKEYRFIYDTQSIDTIAQTIQECGGCLLGLFLDDSDSWITEFPQVPKLRMYSHLLYAGKACIINGKKYIGVLNSWGTDIGNKGWQWISEDYFLSGMVYIGGAMVDETNSVWVKFIDNKGQARSFPTYFVKSIKYMLDRGSKLLPKYDE